MHGYLPRIVDDEIKNKLTYVGGILIEGAKWCGKSTTAKQVAKSVVEFQNPDQKKDFDSINNTKPSLFLDGDKPRVFDEWQMYPVVWDSARMDLDKSGLFGQYIFTGSAKPKEDSIMHTGTGRISKILMRTMSLYESGDSNGTVSLNDIIEGNDIAAVSDLELEDIASVIVRGGWPQTLKINNDNKYRVAVDYVDSLVTEEVKSIDGVERNPVKMRALLKSIARNISTSTSKETIKSDVKTVFLDDISRPTFDDYINILEKLFVIEYVNATNLNIRSKTAFRTTPKIEFVDPSIATALLGLKPQNLIKDLNYFGFLFENLCIRDLKVYSRSLDAELTYYRDKNNFEVDAILKLPDDRWGAIEIKLGAGYVEEAAQNLIKFKEKVDTKKCGEPSFLMVLTGTKYSYKRPDGVYVVSIGCLKN